jgi:hypothetical protein
MVRSSVIRAELGALLPSISAQLAKPMSDVTDPSDHSPFIPSELELL